MVYFVIICADFIFIAIELFCAVEPKASMIVSASIIAL